MGKRSPLVTQHLERIDREALEKHQQLIQQYVKGRYGVYALYKGNDLYYVGLASDLRNRLKQHLKDHHHLLWDHFSVYLTIKESHLKELESRILHVAKPPGNKQDGTFVKSENLRPRFKADMRGYYKDVEERIFGKARPRKKKAAPRKPPRPTAKGPVLAQFPDHPKALTYKGKTVTAEVNEDGTVRFGGKDYTSPSKAAVAVIDRPTCNGWTFWTYERSPGVWVKLDELRRR